MKFIATMITHPLWAPPSPMWRRLEPFSERFGILRPGLWLGLVILAYLLPGAIGHDPWKQDEAYTFGLVLHILSTRDWIVPTLAGQPFMEKPPLFYLSAAALATIFQPWLALHDGARLAGTAWILLALWMTGLAALRLNGRQAVIRTVLLLLGSIGLMTHAHEMITDTALFAGFAIATYGLTWASASALRAGFLLGTGTGIGFMSKGLVEPIIIGLACAMLPCVSATWRSRTYATTLAWAAAFAVPWLSIWPMALFHADRAAFDTWFWINNVGRFTGTARLGADSEPWYYLRVLPWFTLPSGPLAIIAIVRSLKERSGTTMAGINDATRLPLTLAVATMTILSSAATVRSLYALPVLIPLAIIAGRDPLPDWRLLRRSSIAFGGAFALLAAAVWTIWASGVVSGHPPRWDWLLRWLPSSFEIRFEPNLAIVALATTILFAACWMRRADPARHAYRWVAGMAMVWGTTMSLLLPWLDNAKSFRQTFVALAENIPRNECLLESGLGEPQRGMLHYVAGVIPTNEVSDSGECRFIVVQTNHRHELDDPERAGWHPVWQGRRPGEVDEAFTLYERSDAAPVVEQVLLAGDLALFLPGID